MTDINWLRRDAELTEAQACALCGVSSRTWRRWETGATNCPPAVVRLFEFLGGDLSFLGWPGWVMRKGRLWSPEASPYRRGFSPGQVRAGLWLLSQADHRATRALVRPEQPTDADASGCVSPLPRGRRASSDSRA